MSDTSRNCMLFFVKYPVKGAVKSRLAAELDENIALELYRNFILDMLATLDTCDARCLICFHPEHAQKKLKGWLGTQYHYLPQEGKDLGERMKNSFIKVFSMHYERSILLGSDIPDLPSSIVSQAFRSFATNDAVVGPAPDGGYYLIGFRNDTFIPEVFDQMKWGGKAVLRSTRNRLNQRGCRLHLLPEWRDIDTLSDLIAFQERNKSARCRCPKTMSYLATLAIRNQSAG